MTIPAANPNGPWRSSFFSDLGHDIVRHFLTPALIRAVSYDRITGDFAAAFLKAGAEGFSSFFGAGGKMRLITNGRFNESDLRALEAGHAPEKVVEDAILREVTTAISSASRYESEHLRIFTWLLQSGRLEIKVAVLRDAAGNPQPSGREGDFHNKVGIIVTENHQTIAFLGGLNESMRAYQRNSESVACRYSWNEHDAGDLADWQAFFDAVWAGNTVQSKVFSFPDAARRALIQTYSLSELPPMPSPENPQPAPNLWRHQDQAVEAFLRAKSGILEMATGTGKTRTALRIAKQLLDEGKVDRIVVATNGNDLLSQWFSEFVVRFGSDNVHIHRIYWEFQESLQFLNNPGKTPALISSLENLGKVTRQDKHGKLSRALLIVDEVHNLGATSLVQDLVGISGLFPYRLGLSATPERAYDEAGNAFIEQEVGPTVFRFDLTKAIERGILCPFDYLALDYEFTEEDADRMQAVYSAQAAAKKNGTPWTHEELWTQLARVRKTAQGKLAPFAKLLQDRPEILDRCIIFVEDMDYGALVQDIVIEHTLDYHTYYGGEDVRNLQMFAQGKLDCLITCKKLSEGIDIRSVESIVLFASDRGRLVTTQRIGRALRSDPNNPDKVAKVIDFVRESDMDDPAPDEDPSADRDRHDWLLDLSNARRSKA